MGVLGDRRLLARAGVALVLANARYWPVVAKSAGAQLGRYELRALAIRDPLLQALALEKLRDQRFHAQVAATLATLAPSNGRKPAAEAIVALEVIYDYLDGLTEQPTQDPLASGRCLSQALMDAINIEREPTGGYYASRAQADDRGYLESLVADARAAMALLPSTDAIREIAERCTTRFTEAQVRAHAIDRLGTPQLEEWAAREARGTTLGWLEYFAGATSSVLGLHALVAAAADPRCSAEDAAKIDAAYLFIGVIVTVLDSLIDYERDLESTGVPGYTRYFEDPALIAPTLAKVAKQAVDRARCARNSAHHIMTLVGTVAFYASAPSAESEFAQPIVASIKRELQPLITPTLAVMRTWRLAKRATRSSGRARATRTPGVTASSGSVRPDGWRGGLGLQDVSGGQAS
jgi:hypothetical protein